MSDNLNLSMRLTAQDEASPVIRKLISEVKSLQKQLTKSFKPLSISTDFGAASIKSAGANQKRMSDGILRATREQVAALRFRDKVERAIQRDRTKAVDADTKAKARADRDGLRAIGATIRATAKLARERTAAEESTSRAAARSLKERMAFTARMARQRQSEERATSREAARADRERAAAMRESIRLDLFRMRLRERHESGIARDRRTSRADAGRYGQQAISRSRDAYGTLTRAGGATAAAAVAGTGAIVRKSLGVEMDVDSAEINARIYGNLNKQAARDLRDKWAAPLAEELGTGTEKLLTSFVDALKLGIPTEGAKAFAGLTVKTSEAWSVPIETVSDTLGTINSLLTSTGQSFSFDKIKSVANTLQYLAAKQSTTPEKLISFLERGAGASQVLGMSQEAGLAFGSASTSLGNQAGKSGNLFDYVAGRLIEMPKLVRKHGDAGKEAREIVQALGYGSAANMDARRRASPDDFLPDFMERFSKISNPKIQDRAIRNFAGQEWFGEFGRMVKGNATYKEAAQLARESRKLDAIGEVWELHKQKLVVVAKQFSAGWRNILGEFGKVLSPLARQVGDEFLNWSAAARSGGLAARIKASVEGFVEGLGFKDLPALMKGILGDAGSADGGAISAWKSTAREFAAGLKDVFSSIKSVLSAFSGGSPETIARWTGRIIALTGALLILSPVISVITALATGIIALSVALRGAGLVLKLSGLGGASAATKAATTAAPVAGAAPGLLGRLGSFLGIVGSAAAAPLTMDMSKADSDAMMLRLGEWARRRNGSRDDKSSTWSDPPAKALKQSIDDNTKVLKQSFDGSGGLRSLIQKASISGSMSSFAASTGSAGNGGSGGSSSLGSSGIGAFAGTSGAASMLSNTPGQAFSGGGPRSGFAVSNGGGGSAPQGTGKGTRGPANTGSMMTWAMDQLRREGVPEANLKTAAAHLVGQATMESGLDPNKSHDNGTGYGIYGARDPRPGVGRRTDMLKWLSSNGYAANSAEGQMREMAHSAMSGKYRRTKAILMGGGSGNLTADTNTITGEFESPKVINHRAGAVQNALNVGPNGAKAEGGDAAASSPAAGGDVMSRMRALKASGNVIGDQCVALAKAAVGVTGSVTTWNKGVGAEEGSLKAGTPIATFLNRDGSQSSRYAGGGTGTAGAGLDHAAVFNKYLYGKDGKITGMNVAEQYARSGGVRSKDYMFGKGFGEANASNYHAILGRDGKPLGGNANPMSAESLLGSGWKPGAGANAEALAKSVPTAESLAKTVPPKSQGDAGGSGAGNSGTQVHAPITINGGHHDAESLANLVQKRVNDSINTRTHDLDFRSI